MRCPSLRDSSKEDLACSSRQWLLFIGDEPFGRTILSCKLCLQLLSLLGIPPQWYSSSRIEIVNISPLTQLWYQDVTNIRKSLSEWFVNFEVHILKRLYLVLSSRHAHRIKNVDMMIMRGRWRLHKSVLVVLGPIVNIALFSHAFFQSGNIDSWYIATSLEIWTRRILVDFFETLLTVGFKVSLTLKLLFIC